MKQCSKCYKSKPLNSFSKSRSSCKECDKSAWKKWYSNPENRKKHIENAKRFIPRTREGVKLFIIEYLKQHPCIDCGETDVVVLDFDHRDNKTVGISVMTYKNYGRERIKKEIDKCDVRCANCHRRKTAKEQGWFKLKNGDVA